jgi:hypothetical protein
MLPHRSIALLLTTLTLLTLVPPTIAQTPAQTPEPDGLLIQGWKQY